MCGLAGFLSRDASISADDLSARVARMADMLRHRGPDDDGTWVDVDAGIALGHRRLSIIDLSPEGHQPMVSGSGRYVMAFNGEIYNFQGLRAELAHRGHRFRGHSDTEVVLAGFEEWGLIPALERFVGMFAFALWDRTERKLHLVRDRMGEKPLYCGRVGKSLVFGSELKALRVHPQWVGDIDRGALTLLLRHSYVPAPYSIYRNVFKVLPGTVVTVTPDAIDGLHSVEDLAARTTRYWSLAETVSAGAQRPFDGTDDEAVDELDRLLRQAIQGQMVADVPIGAFLSGGIDSSTVVALMQAQSTRPVRTFTIGFREDAYDEANHARAVARHLGTDHTELYVTPKEALEVVPRLPSMYDEPFSDPSQIPTFLVSQLARRHVTVSLSGDGGDELFFGYNQHLKGAEVWRTINRVPRWLRRPIAGAIYTTPEPLLNATLSWLGSLAGQGDRRAPIAGQLRMLADVLRIREPALVYQWVVSHWRMQSPVITDDREPPTEFARSFPAPHRLAFPDLMMYLDMAAYLPDDILVKVDRAAMAVSLEGRIPLLDHRIVEFAWRLPFRFKYRSGIRKWLLRRLLYRHVPQTLVDRPKQGFGVPIDSWLRGPLRGWGESLLNEARLRHEGYFRAGQVRDKWQEHVSGTRDWHYYLWDVVMFQAWLEQERSTAASNRAAIRGS